MFNMNSDDVIWKKYLFSNLLIPEVTLKSPLWGTIAHFFSLNAAVPSHNGPRAIFVLPAYVTEHVSRVIQYKNDRKYM